MKKYFLATLVLVNLFSIFTFADGNAAEVKLCTGILADPPSWRPLPTKEKILKAFAKASKGAGVIASPAQFTAELNFPVDQLPRLIGPGKMFADSDQLREASIQANLKYFDNVLNYGIFNQPRSDSLAEAIRNRRRLIITTAIQGGDLNVDFFKSLQTYAKAMDAEIIVIPMNMQTNYLDPLLRNTPGVHIAVNDIEFSKTLAYNNIKLMGKQINPLMGLKRLGSSNQSLIIGAPKMHMETVSTLENFLQPRQLYTTGAITNPNYNGSKLISARTDKIATADHFLGALILEKDQLQSSMAGSDTAGFFRVRRIEYIANEQTDKKGFTDLNYFYSPDSVEKVNPTAIVLGDLHIGMSDENLMKPVNDLIKTYQPEILVIHDLVDNASVNPHEQKKQVSLAKQYQRGYLSIENEGTRAAAVLNNLLAINKDLEIVVDVANHNNWLGIYLNEGRFTQDPQNTAIGVKLYQAMLDGNDPLEVLINQSGLSDPKRVHFLKPGQSFKVGDAESGRDVELGQHGHVGSNGAKRASLVSLQTVAGGGLVFGHTHTTEWRNRIVNVGTLTTLRPDYALEGASKWVQSIAVVTENGEIQPLITMDGRFYADLNAPTPNPDSFFQPNYPKILPLQGGSYLGQVDQWSQYHH